MYNEHELQVISLNLDLMLRYLREFQSSIAKESMYNEHELQVNSLNLDLILRYSREFQFSIIKRVIKMNIGAFINYKEGISLFECLLYIGGPQYREI